MSVKTRISDGLGSQREASVTTQNALLVQVIPETSRGVPPNDLSNLRFLQEFFTDSLGSSAQRVDGSGTPVEFSVRAANGVTKWITSFRIFIEADGFELGTQDFREYGQISGTTLNPGLTNGIQIEAFQSGQTTAIATEPIRTSGDYLQYSDSYINLVNSVFTQGDYFQVDFVLPKPVVLTEGSTDRMTIRIRDNLITALVLSGGGAPTPRQYALARGYQEFI